MLSHLAPAARPRDSLASLAAKLELLDRARRQLGEKPFEALEGFQDSQYADEGNELGAIAGLDTLEGSLADGGLLGELGLGQARLDAVPRDPLTKDVGDGGVAELGPNLHNSSLTASRRHTRHLSVINDELYTQRTDYSSRHIRRLFHDSRAYSPFTTTSNYDVWAGCAADSAARKQKNPRAKPSGFSANQSLAVTYSGMPERHTTIGAGRFHFRVRNGIGWFPLAMAARQTV
jgi:hypothetical protein